MSRLIDAGEMLKRIESWNTSDAMDKALYNFTLHRIVEQPTVDAEPVIRCKDCKHFDRNEIGRREGGMYNICSEGRGMFLSGDDFCSWAERREEWAD